MLFFTNAYNDYIISVSCNMRVCALGTVYLPVDSCVYITVHVTYVDRQKKSMRCQQVQHNFEHYNKVEKIKTRSKR